MSEETPVGDNSVSVGAQQTNSFVPVPLKERLEAYYRRTDPDFKIADFNPISDGWETEVYSFTRTLRHQTEPLILRMYPGGEAAGKCAHEFRALLALREQGHYPVPRVYDHEADSALLGKPFLTMQKIDGRPLGDVLREATERQPELLTRFVQLFVDLHALDYRPFQKIAGVSPNPMYFLIDLVGRWRSYLTSSRGEAWALPVLDWLASHVKGLTPQLAVIHADFHPHNVLITPDDQLYVIDWSGFSVGDYRYDLAWTLLLISSSGYPQLRDLILSEYARLSGKPVANIEIFDVLAALRRLSDFAGSVGSGAEAMGMRPETVAIMRSQRSNYEQVYALLQTRTGLHLPEIEQLLASL